MAMTKFDPAKPLKDLGTIIDQVEAAKDIDRDKKAQGRMWGEMACRFDEALTGSSSDEGRRAKAAMYKEAAQGLTGLEQAADLCRKLADKLNPVAELSWTQEELDNLCVSVRFFLIQGAYEDEDYANAVALLEKSATALKQRSTPGEGRTLEGRPEWIQVFDLTGDTPVQISHSRGNKESSVGNIKKTVLSYLTRRNVTVTDDISDAVGAAILRSLKDGQREVEIGDFAVIRHAIPPR